MGPCLVPSEPAFRLYIGAKWQFMGTEPHSFIQLTFFRFPLSTRHTKKSTIKESLSLTELLHYQGLGKQKSKVGNGILSQSTVEAWILSWPGSH